MTYSSNKRWADKQSMEFKKHVSTFQFYFFLFNKELKVKHEKSKIKNKSK